MANILSTTYSITKALLDHPNSEHCEHILQGQAQAYACFCEDDSFGPLTRYITCKPCHDKIKEEEAEEMVCCDDCKASKPRKIVSQWRWYDFYAPQGDEPREICETCWQEPKHQNRMKQDKIDRDEELGRDEFYYTEDLDW